MSGLYFSISLLTQPLSFYQSVGAHTPIIAGVLWPGFLPLSINAVLALLNHFYLIVIEVGLSWFLFWRVLEGSTDSAYIESDCARTGHTLAQRDQGGGCANLSGWVGGWDC